MMRAISRPYSSLQLGDWLPEFVKSAKIVGVGESTHGTQEFFRTQADITEHLISHGQARLVLLELPMVYGLQVQELLQHTPAALSRFIHRNPFVTWHNVAISNLLGFIRNWNLEHPEDKVLVVGIDPQNDGCLQLLMSYLDHHGEQIQGLRSWCSQAAVVAAQLKPQSRAIQSQLSSMASDTKILQKIAYELSEQAKHYQHELLDRAFLERALRFAAMHLKFCAQSSQSSQLQRSDVRDELMAETIIDETSRLAEQQRSVVLAHSAHVSYGPPGLFSYGMGYHVRRAIGDTRYSALVTATGGGSTRSLAHASASQREVFVAEPPPPASLERILHNPHDRTPAFFDIKEARSLEKLSDFLNNPIGFRSTGSLVYRNEFTLLRPAEQFDGVIYFPQSTGAIDPPWE